MSDAGRAVFFSYASQDADASRRIAEALRAAGVEVWFDQGEPLDSLGAHGLVGGDAWDAKILSYASQDVAAVRVLSTTRERRGSLVRAESAHALVCRWI